MENSLGSPIRRFVSTMSDEELLVVLETARVTMCDTECLEHVSGQMDLSYEHLVKLTDGLIDYLEEE